jgi:hypothetical protein
MKKLTPEEIQAAAWASMPRREKKPRKPKKPPEPKPQPPPLTWRNHPGKRCEADDGYEGCEKDQSGIYFLWGEPPMKLCKACYLQLITPVKMAPPKIIRSR